MPYEVVLTFKSVDEILKMNAKSCQMAPVSRIQLFIYLAVEQCFAVVLVDMLYKVIITFESGMKS